MNLRRMMEARILELSRKHVDGMLAHDGECDFAMDVARFYPLEVIMGILGVPEADEPRMLDLTQRLFGAEDPDFATGADRAQAANAAVLDFAQYFNRVTAERRANPTDDLASTIANGNIDGEPLRDLQTFSYHVIVATAGHDTASRLARGRVGGVDLESRAVADAAGEAGTDR